MVMAWQSMNPRTIPTLTTTKDMTHHTTTMINRMIKIYEI
jgi:hypothetical protein